MARFTPIDEDLIKRLPLPMAQVCRRAQNAKSAIEQHQAAFYFWEIALKLLSATAVVEYAELRDADPQLAERLRKLARPSLGHWWEFVRRLAPVLAERGDAGFTAVRDFVFGKLRTDLPRTAGLDNTLRELLSNQSGQRNTVRLSELFDRIVQYRNQELGHGAAGQKPASHYERMTGALMGALGELFDRFDVLAGRRLVYVADVRHLPNGHWLVERLELVGESARRVPSYELAEVSPGLLPRSDLVYLERAGGYQSRPAAALPLQSLVHFDSETGEVSFLNSQRGKKNAEYLCYRTGQIVRRDMLPDRRELFAKIFNQTIDGASLETWAGQSAAEEGEVPPEDPNEGVRTLGEFELLSKIDQGGMGVVYRAWQPSLGRPVALKSLMRFGDPKSEARFDREIRALGRVEHPNLVRIFTSGTDGEHWYYAMELVDGANLANVCTQLSQSGRTDIGPAEWQQAASSAWECARSAEQSLSKDGPIAKSANGPSVVEAFADHRTAPGGSSHVELVIDIMRQVAQAAHALHEAGVVHRDIKPGNIMLAADGQRAILMDLGLAQLADETEGRLTKTRQFVGTLRYASPEQLLAASVDRRSDVYSLGATLWELLTFHPLYEATETTPTLELMQRIQSRKPESARKLNPRVPRDLDTIVMKCLEKDPQGRYATAAELADDLERCLRGEPVRAQPPTVGYLLTKYVQKHKVRLSAIAAGLMLLLAGAVYAFVEITSARNKAVTAFANEEKSLRQVESLLESEKKSNDKLAEQKLELQHRIAESYLQSGANDCVNHEPGLGLSSLSAAYQAAPANDPLRWSVRLLIAGWERGLATRFLHDESLEAVAFHPSGEMVLTAGRDGAAHFWDFTTGMPRGKSIKIGGIIWAARFSPKGEWLATGDDERGTILWDVNTRQIHGSTMTNPKAVRALAFSPDGTLLAAAGRDFMARLWDVATQKQVGEAMPHQKEVFCVAFSPDGKTLVTGSDDFFLRLWDVKTQKPIGEPIKHDAGVWTVSYSPNGQYLFTGDWEGQGRLYDAATMKLVHDNIRHKKGILDSVFTPDGEKLFVGTRDPGAQFWDVKKGHPIGQAYGALRSVKSVALSPDGKSFMTGSRDSAARLFKESTTKPVAFAFPHPQAVTAIALSPNGKLMATACQDGLARLWDLGSGQRSGKDMPHEGPVTALAFSPDGKTLLTGSEDKILRQWHSATGEPAGEPIRFRDKITSIACFPDQPWALVGGSDRSAQVIDLTNGKPIKEALRHDGAVNAVAITPDGKTMITGSADRKIRLWDRSTWLPVGKPMQHDDAITSLALDRTGKFLLSGSTDNSARLWDLADRSLLQDMKGHARNVLGVAISPDGRIALSGSDDKSTRLWDVATGKQAANEIEHESDVRAVAFTADGSHYFVARESGTLDMWPTPRPVPDEPERIVAWIRARTLWQRDSVSHRRLTVDEWNAAMKTLADLGGPFPAWDGK